LFPSRGYCDEPTSKTQGLVSAEGIEPSTY
jgi:hypothetical protein